MANTKKRYVASPVKKKAGRPKRKTSPAQPEPPVPFVIRLVNAPRESRKRKRGETEPSKGHFQESLYGKNLGLWYTVDHVIYRGLRGEDHVEWESAAMQKYPKFMVDKIQCKIGDAVYVRTQERDYETDDFGTLGHDFDQDWVAYVLECRAISVEKVYLRVFWLYRPEDLPAVIGGGKTVEEFEAEGVDLGIRGEVIPSNHMEIIDASTVSNRVSIIDHITEEQSQDPTFVFNELMWYRTLDVYARKPWPAQTFPCHTCETYDDFARAGMLRCKDPSCNYSAHRSCHLDYEKDRANKTHEPAHPLKIVSAAPNKGVLRALKGVLTGRTAGPRGSSDNTISVGSSQPPRRIAADDDEDIMSPSQIPSTPPDSDVIKTKLDLKSSPGNLKVVVELLPEGKHKGKQTWEMAASCPLCHSGLSMSIFRE